jgi:hypothetical protein
MADSPNNSGVPYELLNLHIKSGGSQGFFI